MISHIFSKTKPVNFILLSLLLVAYIVFFEIFIGFPIQNNIRSTPYLWQNVGFFIKVILLIAPTLLLIDFILKRNKIVLTHSYALFYFVVLFGIFPAVFSNMNLLLAHFIVLIGLRRIISLKSSKRANKKIFEASMWFLIASYFYDWAVCYFLVLILAIIFYDKNNFRLWGLMLWAVILYVFLVFAFVVGFTPEGFFKDHYIFSFSSAVIRSKFSLPVIGFLLLSIFVLVWDISKIRRVSKASLGIQYSLRLILTASFSGLALYLLSPIQTNAALIFMFFPVAFLWSNATEQLHKFWHKELLMWSVLSIPLWVFLAHFTQN